jgi:hypothetical protein
MVVKLRVLREAHKVHTSDQGKGEKERRKEKEEPAQLFVLREIVPLSPSPHICRLLKCFLLPSACASLIFVVVVVDARVVPLAIIHAMRRTTHTLPCTRPGAAQE